MRIKIDENLPAVLKHSLNELEHEVETVIEEGLAGKNDEIIWKYSQSENRFLITQDLDFSDIRKYKPGTHYGILLIRLMNPSRRKLIEKILWIFKTEPVDLWERCFVVVTENKIRIRKPTS